MTRKNDRVVRRLTSVIGAEHLVEQRCNRYSFMVMAMEYAGRTNIINEKVCMFGRLLLSHTNTTELIWIFGIDAALVTLF